MKRIVFSFALFFLHPVFALPDFDPLADATGSGGTSYSVGANLINQVNSVGDTWASVGSGTAQPVIAAGNLSYAGLPASTGNSVSLPAVAGMTARLGLNTNVTIGPAYYSFILKLTDISGVSTTAANNFFAGFSDTSGSQTASLSRCGARLVAKKNGAGYQLGVGLNNVTAEFAYDPTVRSTNDVLLVVASYERTVGVATNASLWVNPPASSFGSNAPPAPTAATTAISSSTALNANLRAFIITCQTAGEPGGIFDEIRIGKTWTFVTGGPEINTQPAGQTNNAGTAATFSVVARGTTPLSYQWLKGGSPLSNGGNVSGATTSSLTLSNLLASDAADYSVAVTNSYAAITSSLATLTVIDPAINTQPANQSLPPGATASFSVVAGGTPTLTYQWIKDGATVLADGGNTSGSTTSNLTLTGISPTDAGSYTVMVTNGLGNSITSAPGVLTVIDPAVTTQPQSRTNDYGATATFSVTVAGTPTITYQWQKDGIDLADGGVVSGAKTDTLTLTGVSFVDAGGYSLIATNGNGNSTTSSVATLTVRDPIITSQPSSRTNLTGTIATFTVGAAGTGLSYQWKHGTVVLTDGANTNGSQTATLILSSVVAADAGTYSVAVSGSSGQTVTSSNATLTILDPPAITSQPASRTVAVGDKVPFLVTATGSSPLIYQWRRNSAPISGATSVSYVINSAQTNDAGAYTVVVTNSVGSVTSIVANLVVSTQLLLNPTNLIVLRQGDGLQPLLNTGNSIFLDQFTPSGTYVNTVSIPDSGPSALVQVGTAPTEGFLNLSSDRGLLTLVGFNVPRPYSANLGNTASADVPRGIATVNASAVYSLAVSSTAAFSGNNIRSAISDGHNHFWASGGGNGTRYFAPPGVDNVQVQNTVNNTRVVQIFNGDLYFSAASTAWGIHKFTGLPTSLDIETNIIPTGNSASAPFDFVIDPTGTNAYITEDGSASANIYTPGIIKWTYDSGNGTWALNYTLIPGTGTRGLTADFNVNPPMLYVTTTNGANDIANRLLAVQDTGPGAVPITLATAGPNQAFKGVRFGPLPVLSATHSGSSLVLQWTDPSFKLQSATNVNGPYTNISSATSPYTNNTATPAQRFFRLRN